jgi:uncharacterized protein YuzE
VKHRNAADEPAEYLVAAYREISSDDGFVLTAYFTRRPSSTRKVLWNYDAEADVLYLSVGSPKAAVGEGTVLRYDETSREVVGITFIGLKSRLLKGLPSLLSKRVGAGRGPKKSC